MKKLIVCLLLCSAPVMAQDVGTALESPSAVGSGESQNILDIPCAFTIRALLREGGPDAKHPGETTWNRDGSWTVDWPSVKEMAEKPAFLFQDFRAPAIPIVTTDLTVMMARALLYEKKAGTLVENSHPDNNSCAIVSTERHTP